MENNKKNVNGKEKVIKLIRKLLDLSNNNPSEQEAEAALLKAQKLMAEHDVHIEESGPEVIEYSEEICNTKWNMGFRKPLGHVIAENFRCRLYLSNGSVVFLGRATDAIIAKDVFEYAYAFAMKEGNRMYNKAYSMGKQTKGVFNSYTLGFIEGIKEKLNEQSAALMVVTPKDVHDRFEEVTKNFKTSRGGMRFGNMDINAYSQGKTDGRVAMNGKRLGGN